MKKLKKLWQKIVFEIMSIYNSIYFKHMKKKALRMHQTTGKRYYIVPKSKHRLMIVDNTFVKIYNKYSAHKIDTYSLEKMAYYATPAGKRN